MTTNEKALSVKLIISTVFSAVSIYFGELIIPLCVLIITMCLDYLTGMAKAYVNAELSSRLGIKGIVKKVGYIVLIACAACADYITHSMLGNPRFSVAVLVNIWLIINELLSILENLSAMGVPVPKFLTEITEKLRLKTEDQGKNHNI
ncbi:MAG: phage holin family protein [Clostridia bacterium]|nr:phage holin family protein [Clostridia bacterium]